MRIGLAVSVLLWHAYPLSYGKIASLEIWASPIGLGLETILPMFFALSGFLVTGSLERSPGVLAFVSQRAIRIYPALGVEVVLAALVLGPLVTTAAPADYFRDPTLGAYFLNAVGLIHYALPGVFGTNPYPVIVNPSLWTVPFELECYALIMVFATLGYGRSKALSALLFALTTVAVVISLKASGESGTPLNGVHGRILLLCFLAGSLIFRMKDLIPYRGEFAVIAGLTGLLLLRFDETVALAPLPVAYATVFMGLLNPKRTAIIDSGDYSYGIYLYAAPIQQTAAWLLGSHGSWLSNVALALPATCLLAMLSWHCVERPTLKLKKHLGRSYPARSANPPALAPLA